MYTVSAYFWAKILSEFPISVLQPTLQMAICYFAIGLNTALWYKFPLCLLIVIITYNAFTGLGYILGTSISDPKVVAILTPICVVPQMLFAGFFVNQDNIPDFLYPLHHLAVFKYAFQAMYLNEFQDLDIQCMKSLDPKEKCDPLNDYNSPQNIVESMIAVVILWVAMLFISFLIMKSMSRKYE